MDPTLQKSLDTYPVVIEIPIRWGDMDAFQHVNNIVFFQYFESARMAYLEKIQALDYFESTGIGPILASTRCRFRFPVTYPDTLSVGAKVTDIGQDRFTHQYLAFSNVHRKVAAEGEGIVVTIDYKSNAKSPLPEPIKQRIYALENSPTSNKR